MRRLFVLILLSAIVVTDCSALHHRSAPPLSFKGLFNPRYRGWIREHPDQFNWMIFGLIVQPVSQKLQMPRAGGLSTNNVLWETWADDDCTFLVPPDPRHPPSKSKCKQRLRFERNPLAFRIEQEIRKTIGEDAIAPIPPHPEEEQEVRRNPAAFSSIVSRGLWYQEGIAKWMRFHPTTTMKFFRGSIEVKAVWAGTDPSVDQAFPFHWNLAEDNKHYKLVGLHIMTNALPEWTWATWEWMGNPNYCDGADACSDSFGCTPASGCISSHFQSAAPITSAVLNIFRLLKISNEWTGYRLHGSQTLIDNKPTPTVLGNTAIEMQFPSTASCLACHARAKVDLSGKADCTVGMISSDPSGPIGNLEYPSEQEDPTHQRTSFIWAFLRAGSIHTTTPACGK